MTNEEFRDHCRDGDVEMIKLGLQDPNVNPSYSRNYAIRWAAEYGHKEVIALLLQDERVLNTYGIDYLYQEYPELFK